MAETNSNGNNTIDIEISTDTYDKLSGWKGKLQSINDKLTKVEIAGLLLFLGILCATLFLQWILRFFFKMGYPWMDEIMKYSTLWAGFFGASIATSRVAHFRIDLIRLVHNKNIVNRVRAITYFAIVVFCVIFAYATIDYVLTLIDFSEVDYYGYPVWPVFIIVFYFYTITAVRFFLMGIFKIF